MLSTTETKTHCQNLSTPFSASCRNFQILCAWLHLLHACFFPTPVTKGHRLLMTTEPDRSKQQKNVVVRSRPKATQHRNGKNRSLPSNISIKSLCHHSQGLPPFACTASTARSARLATKPSGRLGLLESAWLHGLHDGLEPYTIWVVVKMLVPEIDVKSGLPRCRLMF